MIACVRDCVCACVRDCACARVRVCECARAGVCAYVCCVSTCLNTYLPYQYYNTDLHLKLVVYKI